MPTARRVPEGWKASDSPKTSLLLSKLEGRGATLSSVPSAEERLVGKECSEMLAPAPTEANRGEVGWRAVFHASDSFARGVD